MHISINRYGCIKPVTSYNLGSDRNSSKKDCLLLAPMLAPLLACLLACLPACSLAGSLACLLAGLLACLPACLPACLLAALLPWHTSLRELSREKKSTGRKKKIPRKNGVPHNYGQYIRIKSLLGCQFLAKPSGTSGSLSDSIQQRSSKPELRECTVINTMVT